MKKCFKILLTLILLVHFQLALADNPYRDKLKERLKRNCGSAHIGYIFPGFHAAEIGGGVAHVTQVGKWMLSGQKISAGCMAGTCNRAAVLAPGVSADLFWLIAGVRITQRYYTNFEYGCWGTTFEGGMNLLGRISVYFGRTFVSNNASLFPFKYRNTLSVAIHFYQPRDKRKWFGK